MSDLDKLDTYVDKYLGMIRKRGSEFSFERWRRNQDDKWSKMGSKAPFRNVQQFLKDIFEELDNPKTKWEIETEDVLEFLDSIGSGLRRSLITDNVILYKLPRDEWRRYRSDEWVRKATTYLSDLHPKMKLAADLVTAIPRIDNDAGAANSKSLGGLKLYVFARAQTGSHGNSYVKIKGSGGSELGKVILRFTQNQDDNSLDVSYNWEPETQLKTAQKQVVESWIKENIDFVDTKITEMSGI